MSDKQDQLKEKIRELEGELAAKEAELAQMRLRLSATNVRLESVIDRIGHEIKLASKLQRLLSPVEMPNIAGFEFSTKFVPGTRSGGDYFDIFEHEDRLRFGIVLSSSSGYTMSALFLSVLMKISSKMEARRGLEPHEMIATIQREMGPEMKNDDRASLFYAVVDRRNFEMNYCSWGDTSAYLQLHGEDALTRLEAQAPALNKLSSVEARTMKVLLNPRDRLILCSDGVAKTANIEGKAWGESGLRDAIRSAPRQGVHELRNEILYRNENFSGKHEPDRDQTVLVLEVKDKVIKLAKN
ncbi:MAG: SpoIIE family protein phosphatase [Bdellovibrionaceae bacterium]|nr:SpoIIE family protein phosphatase [Pseudobdellovibrionaceae bacterium]MBX3032804.1 SpoIIE family protein phosphatase [Pseudobdellovibrionaceae bacterium]